jgi:hypothetical protein
MGIFFVLFDLEAIGSILITPTAYCILTSLSAFLSVDTIQRLPNARY